MVTKNKPGRDGRGRSPHSLKRGSLHVEPETLTNLNFRVSQQFHRDFKTFAAQRSKTMVEILQEAFALLKEKDAR